MTVRFIYEPDYARLIPAILIDARASIPAIANQVGTVIKAYTDAAVAAVTPETIVYKLENTENGVIVGYMTVKTSNMGQIGILEEVTLRPAYQNMTAEISTLISNFIQSGSFKADILI
jgi:hypothetical protein